MLEPLVELADITISVRSLMASPVEALDPDMPAEMGFRFLKDHGFDAAPLVADRPTRFVTMDDLGRADGRLINHSRELTTNVLASPSLGVFEAITLLREDPFFFVLDGTRLTGIVTRAELQKEPISLLLLGFILSAEKAATLVIRGRYGDVAWRGLMTEQQLAKVDQVFASRQEHNVQISQLECLMLHQRMALLGRGPDLRNELGYGSREQWRSWTRTLGSIRDVLAHGGDVLRVESDPLRAIDMIISVRRFAERMWALAGTVRQPLSA